MGLSPTRWIAAAGFGLATAVWPAIASAGPLNVEMLDWSDEPGWAGRSEFSFGLKYGNIDRYEAAYAGFLQYKNLHPKGSGYGKRRVPDDAPPFFKDRWLVHVDQDYAWLNGNNVLNTGLAHTRYTRMWLARLGNELFLQSQYNQFTRLRMRVVTGLLARTEIVHRKPFVLYGGTGYMLEFEFNDIVEGDDHPARTLNHRWNTYVVANFSALKEKLLFRESVYVQPRFDNFADIRVLAGSELRGNLTEHVSLGILFTLSYDSLPPAEIEPADVSLKTTLGFTFG